MPTLGEKLKAERERRGTPLDEVAATTRIGKRYLEALERDEFDELPGPRGFGKLYIRAYAEMLHFDPEPLIREFDAEVGRRLRVPAAAGPERSRRRRVRYVPPPRSGADEPTDEPTDEAPPADADPAIEADHEPTAAAQRDGDRPGAPISTSARGTHGRRAMIALAALAVAAAAFSIMLRDDPAATGRLLGDRPTETRDLPPSVESVDRRGPLVESVETIRVAEAPPAPVEDELPAASTPPVRPDSSLRVASSSLGVGIQNLAITDRRSVFRDGEQATFLTRVRGGVTGQQIRHVWLRDGRAVQSIPLTLGGSSWRTYSTKTLWGAGAWTVEARASDGRVLARATFAVRDAPR